MLTSVFIANRGEIARRVIPDAAKSRSGTQGQPARCWPLGSGFVVPRHPGMTRGAVAEFWRDTCSFTRSC